MPDFQGLRRVCREEGVLRTVCGTASLLVLCIAAGAARADIVRVRVTGEVENNGFAQGVLAGILPGEPVTMQFDLDSGVYLDSPNLPGRTRGYPFVAGSFSLVIGGVACPLQAGFPHYFVVRNNDPGIDGFFISQGTDIDTELPLVLGTTQSYGIAFSRTFGDGVTLSSLDIRGAVGSWAFNNLSSYNFTVQRNEIVVPMVLAYQTLTITNITPACDSIDFNGDGLFPDTQDIADFLTVFAGGVCTGQLPSDPPCNTDIDFNNDGLFPDTADIDSLLSVFSGGSCL